MCTLVITASTTLSGTPTGRITRLSVIKTYSIGSLNTPTPTATPTGMSGTVSSTEMGSVSTITVNTPTPTTTPSDMEDIESSTENGGISGTMLAGIGGLMVVISALIVIIILLIFLVWKNTRQKNR